jgi:hypothetical protein
MDAVEARETIRKLRSEEITPERARRLLSPNYILIWEAERFRDGTAKEDGSGTWVAQKRYNWKAH